MTLPVIAMAGGTHLGVLSAAAAAAKGFPTLLYDPDPSVIDAFRAGRMGFFEPGLDDLLRDVGARLTATAVASDLAKADVVFVAGDTPTDDSGTSDLADIERLLNIVLAATRPESTRVVLSQVPPGFTRARQPATGRLHCQVETLIFGRAVERALGPERFIVGCPGDDRVLPPAYQQFLAAFGCPIMPMALESAELAKISINAFLCASVSMTNTLAGICEVTGADWSEIAPTLRLDARIGPKAYLAPGLGIGGGNLMRDLATILRLAAEHGTHAGVVDAFIDNHRDRRDWVLRQLRPILASRPKPYRLAVLGLAYKENTTSTKNSPAVALLQRLEGVSAKVYDPQVRDFVLPPWAAHAADALSVCEDAEALAIMTPWPEFKDLDPVRIAAVMRGRLVLDPYGVLDRPRALVAKLDLRSLGRPQARSA